MGVLFLSHNRLAGKAPRLALRSNRMLELRRLLTRDPSTLTVSWFCARVSAAAAAAAAVPYSRSLCVDRVCDILSAVDPEFARVPTRPGIM